MTGDIVPFGKYKGQPVEALQGDPAYADWLAAQPWFLRQGHARSAAQGRPGAGGGQGRGGRQGEGAGASFGAAGGLACAKWRTRRENRQGDQRAKTSDCAKWRDAENACAEPVPYGRFCDLAGRD